MATMAQQIVTAITWYIWKGSIFRVPVSTLQKQKPDGGWNMIDIVAKCRALLYARMWLQINRKGSMTAEWLKHWMVHKRRDNLPPPPLILRDLDYIYVFEQDMPYIETPKQNETPKSFRKRLYITMQQLLNAEKKTREMRIVQQEPLVNWRRVWENLHDAGTAHEMKVE
jgi:hypothetical protein